MYQLNQQADQIQQTAAGSIPSVGLANDPLISAERILFTMQGLIGQIKSTREEQDQASENVHKLAAQLAEAQARESELVALAADQERNWQELMLEFIKFGDLNADNQ